MMMSSTMMIVSTIMMTMVTASHTARNVPGKVTDKILRMEESSLYTALESPDTMVALAVGGLAGALWEESVLLANARHLFGCYCWFIGGNGGY